MELNSSAPLYSVVVPVFQSATYIKANIKRIAAVMDSLGSAYEMILVDDHSTDGTWPVLLELKAEVPHLRVYKLDRNIGQTPATLAGATQAKGEYIITLDDDLQHPPEEIPKLIAAMQSHEVDIVFGDPENRYHAYKQHPALVGLGKFLFHQVFLRRYKKLNFFTTFRLFRASLLRENGGTWSHMFFIWQLKPARAMHIPTKHQGRQQGSTNHTLGKLLRHFAPFLCYFGVRTAVVLQVLVVLAAVAYIVQLQYARDASPTAKNIIVFFALAVIFAKLTLTSQLRRLEQRPYTITQG